DLTSRLEMRGGDWSRTKAFAHPAENQGDIRLNLKGRERDGIAAPEEAKDVMEEITACLLTFTHLHGSPVIRSRERAADLCGTGTRAHQLPSLVVRRVHTPATRVSGVTSPQYGTVLRHAVGSARSRNHSERDAWALVVLGSPT